MGTLVDSNVILDIVTEDPVWSAWSVESLAAAADRGPLVINPIVYAEVSIRFSRVEDLDDVLSPQDFVREPLPWSAGFLAGKAFAAYRKRGGGKGTLLPDFYIGAHAAVAGHTLLTRDAARYRTYYPTVDLHAPTR